MLSEKRTMIFYEAPHKLANTLADFYKAFPDRKLTIARELTKLHEEIIRTTTTEAYEKYSDFSLKGEIVLILEGSSADVVQEFTLDDAVTMARKMIDEGIKPTQAAKDAAAATGLKKNDIYRELI